VDDQTTWQELDVLGCDAIQGYGVSRPVPADDSDQLTGATARL
jgi:EAL domain-containing protein (putative c-di-GMP-specific phosphodiesterase class I)